MEFSELEVFSFLISAALVFLMVPGLALFYGGLVRHKNVIGTMMHSVTAIGVVSVLWVLWGYSLAFSTSVGGLGFVGGLTKFGMVGVGLDEQAFMIFQGMFAIITPALITGAYAERMKFTTFGIFTILWVTIVYAPLAHWVWGQGGWLGSLGALDFAGGTVVHINSGLAALAAVLIIGPRVGFRGQPNVPHNVPMVLLGAGMLWFGWFGFNAGSALAANGQAANAFVTTNLSAAAGLVSWTTMSWVLGQRPSIVGAATGAIAGLAAITPASGFVGPMPAIVIGLVAGCLCYGAVKLMEKLNVDDALAVWGVHGMGSTWGVLATGIFIGIGFGALADGVSRGEQVLYQLAAMGASWGWAFVTTSVILLALKYTIGLRVREDEEGVGLDVSQHGEGAYIGEDRI
jgi:Amt family ammonium transporter